MNRRTSSSSSRAVYLTIAVAVLIPMWKLIVGREMFFLLDAVQQHYPFQAVLSRILAGNPGDIPVWDPYILSGTPLLADPQRHVYYPPALLYRLLPFPAAFGCFLAFHLFMAGAGMAAFLKSRGLGNISSGLGAVGFSLGAGAAVLMATPPVLASYCWLPWVALFAARLTEKPGLATSLSLGLSLAWLAYAGYPPYVIYAGVLALIVAATGRRWTRTDAGIVWPWVILALLAAGAVSAAVYLPFADYLPETDRGARLSLRVALLGVLRPWDLVGMFSPMSVLPFDEFGGPNLNEHWTRIHCVGVLVLALAVCGVSFARNWRSVLSPLSLAAAGILLALGPMAPVIGPLLLRAGPLAWLRHSGLWMGLAEFGVCWLGALGLESLLGQLRRREGRRALTGWLFAAVLLASMGGTSSLMKGWVARNWGDTAMMIADRSSVLFHPALVLSAGLMVLWLARRRELSVRTAGIGVIAITVMELLVIRVAIQPATSADGLMMSGPAEKFLLHRESRDGWFRVFVTPRHQKRGVEKVDDPRELPVRIRESLRSNLPAAAGLKDAYGSNPMKPAVIERLYGQAVWSATYRVRKPWDRPALEVFDMLGVKYLITRGTWKGPGYRLVYDGHVQVYRREGSVRPVWIMPREAGRLEEARSDRPGEWLARVSLGKTATLVISESCLSGWRLESGPPGLRPEAYRGSLLSVRLPAGRHEIRMRYSPGSVAGGLLAGSFVLLALLVTGGYLLARRL